MVWLLVSSENDIVIRLNLVCEIMLCEIVCLYCACVLYKAIMYYNASMTCRRWQKEDINKIGHAPNIWHNSEATISLMNQFSYRPTPENPIHPLICLFLIHAYIEFCGPNPFCVPGFIIVFTYKSKRRCICIAFLYKFYTTKKEKRIR